MKSKLLCIIIYSTLILLFAGCKNFEQLVPNTQTRTVTVSQEQLIKSFSGLTENDGAACNLILDVSEITETICRLVSQARKGSEILFVVDKTGSMSDDIDFVKENINSIIDCLPKGCRLGGVAYGDNRSDGANWYSSYELTEDYNAIRDFINNIRVTGGGDTPESVYDALWKALDEMTWKDCNAPDIIIVMGDAPPKTGSGTDHSDVDVLNKAKSICPTTKFYPVIILQL